MKSAFPARSPFRSLPRFDVAVRILTAVVGGYILASLASAAVALTFPGPRGEALLAGGMCAFVVYPATVVWSFLTASALRACMGVTALCALLAIGVLVLRSTL